MKIKWDKKYTIISIYAALVLFSAIIFYFIVDNLDFFLSWVEFVWNVLRPIVYGLVVAYLIWPLVDSFERRIFGKRLKKKSHARSLSILCAYIVVILVVVLLISFIIPQIMTSVAGLFSNSNVYMKNFESWGYSTLKVLRNQGFITIEQFNEYSEILGNWVNVLVKTLTDMLPQILDATKQFTLEVFNFFMGFFISIYVLSGKEKFASQSKRIMYSFLPKKVSADILRILRITNEAFSSFIKGKFLDALIMGILCFIGTSILGIPYAILISTLVGVCNIIPYFGPFFGAIPSILIILLVDPMKALWLTIFLVVLQQFEGNVLGPKIIGQSTGMGAFWIITAIIVGGGLWGIVGMFIGIPIFTVIYTLVREIVQERLKKHGIVEDGDEDIIIYGMKLDDTGENDDSNDEDDSDVREW